MKPKKIAAVMRGLSAVTASLMALSIVGANIVDGYRARLDSFLGTESYVTKTDADSARFVSDYATFEEMKAAAKEIAIREGEEGTVIMKNDNNVLPLDSGKEVALFGLAAYAPYPYDSGDLKAGNEDAVDLVQAFTDAGVKVNEAVMKHYQENILNKHTKEVPNRWTGEMEVQVAFDKIYEAAPGDMTTYQIYEAAPIDWTSQVDKENTVGVCVFARGAGEGNTYAPGSALNDAGEATGEDPLALSEDELALIDAVKETCSQVIVLINSGNTMVLKEIAEGGAHEVDGIAYIGCLNDYQAEGVINVLTGKVNATGALSDTYVADHASIPAVMNFGGGYYADYEIVATNGEDARYPDTKVENIEASSFGGTTTYNGGTYIVEAEGIYVGYKYYETRYYDAIVNPESGALSSAGATQAETWDYDKEVLYGFGHGLSYLDYEQTIKSVQVDNKEDGEITAVVEIKNLSDQDGYFLAQLYVQQPYTEYDKENLVEKSAVMFLNSAKTNVAAGQTEEVTITIPTKYLASYDYTNAKTYILDEGDYYFTAAAGAHEAVNNILAAQGYEKKDGMDADTTGAVVTWSLEEFDDSTFAIQNGVEVTNVVDDADLNYWTGEDTVTYLSRQDWEGTYPINYNEVEITIGDSPKKEEWIKELRGETYTIQTDNKATEGSDQGLRFDTTNIQYDQLENVDDSYWNTLVSQITIDEAIGAVIHGGSQTDILTNVDNPVVNQNEGVSGFTATYTDEESGETYRFNVHSQTLLGTSFNPQLAYDWGRVEGNSGLWLKRYHLWGTGLTQRRTPYNGRNYEYISEDPMLTNRMGYGILQGCAELGIINGPKHMGFNDQEHNRGGISAYMNEQKFRETDLRCFQGGLEDADGLAVMIAFNRIGATNASHSVAMLQTILRGEWAYTGLISTDMMNNSYYFNPESMIMAGVTQVADFATNDNHINMGEGGVDATWPYITEAVVSKDSALVEQARENLKYQLYTFANSAVLNVSTERVQTWWDQAISIFTYASGAAAVATMAAWIVLTVKSGQKKKEEE